VIFSKTYCPYSTGLVNHISSLPIDGVSVYELDKMSSGVHIFAALYRQYDTTTVPILFHQGELVGDSDQSRAYLDQYMKVSPG